MKIIFIRHSKVLFRWELLYNSNEFDLACIEYDISPIKIDKNVQFEEKIVYVSYLQRTEYTANVHIVGEKEVIKTDILNEIPLRSFVDTKLKLPTILWMLLGRLQWYFNIPRQIEGRRKSKKRVNIFLDFIEQKQQDCIVIGHGFFFLQMVNEMKKRGFVGDMRKRISNEEARVFESKSI